jgi:alkylation response protein AidB-like acyl-CoA dehydrogenase
VKDFLAGRDQRAFAETLASALTKRAEGGAADASAELWKDLADLGLLGLCTPAVGGTPLDLAVAMETLGAQLCPGPVLATIAAAELLAGEQLEAVAGGLIRPTLTDGRHVPWAGSAGLVIELDETSAWLAETVDEPVSEPAMSGETWGIARIARGAALGDATRATAMFNLGLASYLLGAARRLIEQGARHAATREQFGQPIGAFQAVAHPLADAHAETNAAWALAQLVAAEFAAGPSGPGAVTRSRQLRAAATRASLGAAYAVHQVMGAMGFSTESGVATASTRIRQWSLLPPLAAAPGQEAKPGQPEKIKSILPNGPS